MTEFRHIETTLGNYEKLARDFLKAHPDWWCSGYRVTKIHNQKNDHEPYPTKWDHDPRNLIDVVFHDGDIGVGLRYKEVLKV